MYFTILQFNSETYFPCRDLYIQGMIEHMMWRTFLQHPLFIIDQ